MRLQGSVSNPPTCVHLRRKNYLWKTLLCTLYVADAESLEANEESDANKGAEEKEEGSDS